MKYRVLNPEGLPAADEAGNRIHIIAFAPGGVEGGQRWYEGDTFTPPEGMNVEWLLAEGYIEPVGRKAVNHGEV